MIFYRLALQRLIEYLEIGKPSPEEELRMILLRRKPKVIYKTKLKIDETLNFYISILSSILGIMIWLSIPFAALEIPYDAILQRQYPFLFTLAVYLEPYALFLDFIIIIIFVTLIYVTTKMILDGIKNTDISMSPWVERGKYKLPPKNKKEMLKMMAEAAKLSVQKSNNF